MAYQMSVCLSVAFVYCELSLLTLTCIENNYMTNYSGDITRRNHKPNKSKSRKVPNFSGETEVGREKAIFGLKIENMSETVR